MVRLLARVVSVWLVGLLSVGCFYMRGNIGKTSEGYTSYPTSIEAEHARRARRRRNALIAAPLEIVGGVALTALALYAPSSPSDATTVSEGLADAGKEILGRLLLAAIGSGVAASGVGDALLGATDPLFRSPLIRGGRLVPADEIDGIDPPRSLRAHIHASNTLGTRGVGGGAGIGVSHWLSPQLRLVHSLSGEVTLPFRSADRTWIVSGETMLERAFGREQLGLRPSRTLGLYVGGGWAAIEDRPDAPALRGGVAFGTHGRSYRVGTTYLAGDRRPSVELSLRIDVESD